MAVALVNRIFNYGYLEVSNREGFWSRLLPHLEQGLTKGIPSVSSKNLFKGQARKISNFRFTMSRLSDLETFFLCLYDNDKISQNRSFMIVRHI